MTAPNNINYIDVDLMQKWCHPFAVEFFNSIQEPMSLFHEHDRALLESALGNPRQSFGGADLYPTLADKAAILYYGLIKNHAFSNGNKRMATATFLVFLYINSYWLKGDRKNEDYLVDLAKRVASSEGYTQKSEFLSEIKEFLQKEMCTIQAFREVSGDERG